MQEMGTINSRLVMGKVCNTNYAGDGNDAQIGWQWAKHACYRTTRCLLNVMPPDFFTFRLLVVIAA